MKTAYTVVYVSDNVVQGNEPLGDEFEFDGEPDQRMLDFIVRDEGIMDARTATLTSVEKRPRGWYMNFSAVDEEGEEFEGRFAVALTVDVESLGDDDIESEVLFGE